MKEKSESNRLQEKIDAAIATKTFLCYEDAKAYLRLQRLNLQNKSDYERWFESNKSIVGEFLPQYPEDYYSNHK
jgi:hypothetical protein